MRFDENADPLATIVDGDAIGAPDLVVEGIAQGLGQFRIETGRLIGRQLSVRLECQQHIESLRLPVQHVVPDIGAGDVVHLLRHRRDLARDGRGQAAGDDAPVAFEEEERRDDLHQQDRQQDDQQRPPEQRARQQVLDDRLQLQSGLNT